MDKIVDPVVEQTSATSRAAARPVIPIQLTHDEVALYEIRRKIHPRSVHGWFAGWRIALVVATQLVFYGLAWLTWNGRQAVLFDLGARKFYLFGMLLWPQDVIYLAVLLIIAALSLFLFTAIAGRLWCGYACPQTVYTEIFMWIERRIEGDRIARLRLDGAPMSLRKVSIRGAKHAAWLAIAAWTGCTFVGYFTPIRELGAAVLSWRLGPWETFWVLFYSIATYANAGWLREQVCKHMCPYARFQSVMFDKDTLVITYDGARGDPRGSRSKSVDPRSKGLGDCVDCGICVQVCPTGIDIRNGLQYECIGCAACIDGCDQVMDKMGYARGLIRYTTATALAQGLGTRAMWRRVLRPRTVVYAAVLAAITVAGGASLAMRNPLRVDVIRDRGALAREAAPGRIENVYRVQVMNTDETARRYAIDVAGLPGIQVVGVAQPIELQAASTRLLALRLQAPVDAGQATAPAAGAHKIELTVRAVDDDAVVRHEPTTFIIPR
ncbi:MAG TPA: cytochrome c oxidase accessory protein CcoG [Casimicrobiaceae bacterium]|nr:cytochrome c oxidase accessory protein CcoG [Casimicrobiaceae bacterium]